MVSLTNWENSYDIVMHRKTGVLNKNIKTKGYEKDCDNDDGSDGGYCCFDCLHE